MPESPRPPTRTQLQGLPEEPLVTAVTKLEHERVALGGRVAHRRQLHGAAANGQPAVRGGAAAFGGDTLFVNRFLVYERSRRGCSALPPGSPPSIGPPSRCWPQRGVKAKVLSSEHPVVRTHPETAARRCTSTADTPHTSGAGANRKASPCWSTCSSTKCGRSSPAVTAGSPAPWRSGTTAAPSTCRSYP